MIKQLEQQTDFTDDSISKMEFVLVKGGSFLMGDSSDSVAPVHEVHLGDFNIGKFPITQEQWEAVMGNNPSQLKGKNLPVDRVSWYDAQRFIKKLNKIRGNAYRLPTEAEWEYAARSGGKFEKWSGTPPFEYEAFAEIDDYAWYQRNSGGVIHPVGTKKPNGLGLYDMSGNVWEWTQDVYDGSYYDATHAVPVDTEAPANVAGRIRELIGRLLYLFTPKSRILRGGAADLSERYIRTVHRNWFLPGSRFKHVGLRLARSL